MVDIVAIRMIDNNTFGWISRETPQLVRFYVCTWLTLCFLPDHRTSSRWCWNQEYHSCARFDRHDKHQLDDGSYTNHWNQQRGLPNWLPSFRWCPEEQDSQEEQRDVDAWYPETEVGRSLKKRTAMQISLSNFPDKTKWQSLSRDCRLRRASTLEITTILSSLNTHPGTTGSSFQLSWSEGDRWSRRCRRIETPVLRYELKDTAWIFSITGLFSAFLLYLLMFFFCAQWKGFQWILKVSIRV